MNLNSIQKIIVFLIPVLFYGGCSSKNNIPLNREDIIISKDNNFLFYAYLKNSVKLTKVSKNILSTEEDEEIIRVYKNGYYPIYDIFSKGIGCYANKTYKANSFCSSIYIKKDSPVQDTVLNTMGSLIGLTIAKGFNYHKIFDNKKFKESIIKSKLPLIKKYVDKDTNILYISKIKIDVPTKPIDDIQILSKTNKDIILVYDENNYLQGVVKTYDLREKDFFEATSILAKRLMKITIQQKKEDETSKNFIQRTKKISSAKTYFIHLAMQSLMGNIKLDNLKYNADEQFMYADLNSNHEYKEKIKFRIPIDKAMEFKNKRDYDFQLIFQYTNNKISLKNIKVDSYLAQQTSFTPHSVNEPTYSPPSIPTKGFIDDLPILLSEAKTASKDPKKWLFVIGVEEYDNNVDNVIYSKRSAKMFTKVAQKGLGITNRNSYLLIGNDATRGKIEDRLRLMLENIKEGDSIYFYYSGHGIPVLPNRVPYLLPKDKIPDYIGNSPFFKLSNIYNLLSNSKADKVIAIMDSCFSGSTDGKSVFKGVAGSVLIPKKVTFNQNKMVVFSAGRDKQFSNMYPKRGHRLFSYFVMKALLEGKRDLSNIYNEVYSNVRSISNGFGDLKRQEPTIEGNKKLRF